MKPSNKNVSDSPFFTTNYESPLGTLLLACDNEGLVGLWFEGQRHFANGLSANCKTECHPLLQQVQQWLDYYFAGERPTFTPPLHFIGTEFRIKVWTLLCKIPYGETRTYKDIAQQLTTTNHQPMSAQAVGGAIGHNPISIIVPCHRVIGVNKQLIGYAGGLEKKKALLRIENCDFKNNISPYSLQIS